MSYCVLLERRVVAHHLYLQVHHLLVQSCLCPLDLLDPLEGAKETHKSSAAPTLLCWFLFFFF